MGATATATRTLTGTDVEALALAAGNIESFSLDLSRGAVAGRVIAPGAAAVSFVAAVLYRQLPGPGSVIESTRLQYHDRLHAGDTITATVKVLRKHDADRKLEFECRATRADGQVLVEGICVVVAPEAAVALAQVTEPEIILRRNAGFAPLFARCASLAPVACAVVHPCDGRSLAGAIEAARAGLIDPILVGPEAKIRATAEAAGIDLAPYRLVHERHSHAAADRAVSMAVRGEVEAIMKGSLHTDELMGVVVEARMGLRTDRRISHAFVICVPAYPRLLFITDAAINIAPDLDTKADICRNVIGLAKVLGIDTPKVAIMSAAETVSAKLPSSVDAASLCKMADRGQITGGVLDGPLAFDNAISLDAARSKGIVSPVAGQADVLLVPDIEAGNMLAKQLTYFAGAEAAGIVLGARVPIVLTSRADDVRARLASAAVMKLVAHERRTKLMPG